MSIGSSFSGQKVPHISHHNFCLSSCSNIGIHQKYSTVEFDRDYSIANIIFSQPHNKSLNVVYF